MAGNAFGFPSPFAYIAGPGYVQMSLLYDTLLWKDASGSLLPWLARRVRRSPDGRTYTFELRDDVRWHDGRRLTADDVAFTFEYFARQTLGPLLVAQPFAISGARARSATRVEITLEIPAVTFLESVAGAVPIIPRHVWHSISDAPRAQDRSVLVGSGPYRLASFSLGEGSARFEANRDYFLGLPFVRRVELHPVADELTALRGGDIDVAQTPADGVGPDALAPFRSDPAFGIIRGDGRFTFPLIFNLARSGPLGDARVRRAIAMAVDRVAIVERLLGGQAQPGNPGFLPPGHASHVNVEQYRHDPLLAERLLEQAGFGRTTSTAVRTSAAGATLSFSLLTGNSPIPPSLDLIRADLRDVGIEVRPQAVDLPTLFGRLQNATDDIALSLYPGPGGTAPNADPDTLRTFYSSRIRGRLGGAQGYVDEEFDGLADSQLVSSDRVERDRLLARMQHLVARDLPVLPVYYPTLFTVFRRSVLDRWYYTPGGFAGGLPGPDNKHVLITGRRTGLAPRRR